MNVQAALLARYAESLFWMARYMERLENLARLIDVTQTFESPGLENEAWDALVRIHADETHFAATYGAPGPDNVKRYYLLDTANPNSIRGSIEAARMNARTLRPLISTEMWKHLNVFHRDLLEIEEGELYGDSLSRLCTRIKEGVQAHTGITEGTLFRDQGWHFYEMGRLIERADQTTRLLDIKYHQLVPIQHEERRIAELTQWSAVLRATAGYHAFRRIAPVVFTPQDVVSFLIADPGFPRSVALCIVEIEAHLTTLRSRYGLRGTGPAQELVEELRAGIVGRTAQAMISGGLHDFLDGVQRDLIQLAGEIGTAFFRDWRPLAPTPSQVG